MLYSCKFTAPDLFYSLRYGILNIFLRFGQVRFLKGRAFFFQKFMCFWKIPPDPNSVLLCLMHYLCGESLAANYQRRRGKITYWKTHEHIALWLFPPKRGQTRTKRKVHVFLKKNPSTGDFSNFTRGITTLQRVLKLVTFFWDGRNLFQKLMDLCVFFVKNTKMCKSQIFSFLNRSYLQSAASDFSQTLPSFSIIWYSYLVKRHCQSFSRFWDMTREHWCLGASRNSSCAPEMRFTKKNLSPQIIFNCGNNFSGR